MPDIKELHVRREDGSVLKLTGRVAWASKHLLDAGETGRDPNYAPRPEVVGLRVPLARNGARH